MAGERLTDIIQRVFKVKKTGIFSKSHPDLDESTIDHIYLMHCFKPL
jgi:hypothetical protein